MGSVELMVRSEWGMRRQREGGAEGEREKSMGRHEVREKYRSEGRREGGTCPTVYDST